jgi:hypothetical protein
MTTVQPMLRSAAERAATLLVAGALAALMFVAGCAGHRGELQAPQVLVAPYNHVQGDVLWAVAPLANETGVSFLETGAIADQIVAKIDEVRGLSCLPLNRTLAAMRARGMRAITSPNDARVLADTLGVDGLIVGTITAYDPYDPPKLGLKLALFARNAGVETARMDPLRLQCSYTEQDRILAQQYLSKPVATVSEHFDGANHGVQMELRRYAHGRCEPDSALGWKSIMQSMDLYTQFAAYAAVSRLIDQERLRLGAPPRTATASADGSTGH